MAVSLISPFYLSLQTQLQQLQCTLQQASINVLECMGSGQYLIQFWQTNLAAETGDHLPPECFSQWRSLHTEIHRELRLLNVDLMFLKGMRTEATKAKKIQVIGDRLTKILQYCDHLLKLDPTNKPES